MSLTKFYSCYKISTWPVLNCIRPTYNFYMYVVLEQKHGDTNMFAAQHLTMMWTNTMQVPVTTETLCHVQGHQLLETSNCANTGRV